MVRANAGDSARQDDMLSRANQTFETLGQWLFPPHPKSEGAIP